MMSKLRRPGPICRVATVGLVALLAGCRHSGSAIELVSYRDPLFPRTYDVTFDTCVYRVDADGDLHIAARAQRGGDDGPITQLLHVHVFWQPRPGITFANETTTTATVRYAVVTPAGTAAYVGTAFVYPRRRGAGLEAQVERGQLQLDSVAGEVPEILGAARFSGTLHAQEDEPAATDLIRALELHAAGEQSP